MHFTGSSIIDYKKNSASNESVGRTSSRMKSIATVSLQNKGKGMAIYENKGNVIENNSSTPNNSPISKVERQTKFEIGITYVNLDKENSESEEHECEIKKDSRFSSFTDSLEEISLLESVSDFVYLSVKERVMSIQKGVKFSDVSSKNKCLILKALSISCTNEEILRRCSEIMAIKFLIDESDWIVKNSIKEACLSKDYFSYIESNMMGVMDYDVFPNAFQLESMNNSIRELNNKITLLLRINHTEKNNKPVVSKGKYNGNSNLRTNK